MIGDLEILSTRLTHPSLLGNFPEGGKNQHGSAPQNGKEKNTEKWRKH